MVLPSSAITPSKHVPASRALKPRTNLRLNDDDQRATTSLNRLTISKTLTQPSQHASGETFQGPFWRGAEGSGYGR